MNSLPSVAKQDVVPVMELSDRLKCIIKELRITEEILNSAYYNTAGNSLETVVLTEPEYHLQSVDAIEKMTSGIWTIAMRLAEVLR